MRSHFWWGVVKLGNPVSKWKPGFLKPKSWVGLVNILAKTFKVAGGGFFATKAEG